MRIYSIARFFYVKNVKAPNGGGLCCVVDVIRGISATILFPIYEIFQTARIS